MPSTTSWSRMPTRKTRWAWPGPSTTGRSKACYIAYVRQIYLDAEHYKLVKDAYAKNPVGMARPEYDRALEGVLDSPRILLPANRLVEIDRMLHLAADLKQPVIIYGGREPSRPEAAPLLKHFNTPVLLSMRWPEASRDADPDEP